MPNSDSLVNADMSTYSHQTPIAKEISYCRDM